MVAETQLSQKEILLSHFYSGRCITMLEALALYRIYNLKARVHELRKEGHSIQIKRHIDPTGKPYAQYFIPSTLPKVA